MAQMTYTDQRIVDSYRGLFEGLSALNKLELIEELIEIPEVGFGRPGGAVLPIIRCLPFGQGCGPIHDEFDLLIGVTAVENRLILVADNQKDFARLEGIALEN